MKTNLELTDAQKAALNMYKGRRFAEIWIGNDSAISPESKKRFEELTKEAYEACVALGFIPSMELES